MHYRLDKNSSRVGVMIYVRENMPSKILERRKLPQDIEVELLIFIELNFRKVKCLLFGTYHERAILKHSIKI